MISLYRRIVINRMNRTINPLKDRALIVNDVTYSLFSNNKDDKKILADTIANFHKLCEHISAKDPMELENDAKFLGVIRSTYSTSSNELKDDNPEYFRYQQLTGIMTFAFQDDKERIFFVPSIILYKNDLPVIFVPKAGFKVGGMIDTDLVKKDAFMEFDIKEDFIQKIYNYAYNNLDDTDHTMGKIYLELSDANTTFREGNIDIKENISRLGYNSEIVGLLDKILYTPLVKLADGNISEIVVTNGMELKSVPFVEFKTSKMLAVILTEPNKNLIVESISDLNEDIYSIAGKNFYIDDAEWKQNENGGYSTHYRVVSEKEVFKENVIKGVIYGKDYYAPIGEVKVLESLKNTFTNIKKESDRLIQKMKQHRESKNMYKLFAKEVCDKHNKLQRSLKVGNWSAIGGFLAYMVTEGMWDSFDMARDSVRQDIGVELPSNRPNKTAATIITAATSALFALGAYLMLPKNKETDEGLEMIYEYYGDELTNAEKERKVARESGNLKEVKALTNKIAFLRDVNDRIKREIERRREVGQLG